MPRNFLGLLCSDPSVYLGECFFNSPVPMYTAGVPTLEGFVGQQFVDEMASCFAHSKWLREMVLRVFFAAVH